MFTIISLNSQLKHNAKHKSSGPSDKAAEIFKLKCFLTASFDRIESGGSTF